MILSNLVLYAVGFYGICSKFCYDLIKGDIVSEYKSATLIDYLWHKSILYAVIANWIASLWQKERKMKQQKALH